MQNCTTSYWSVFIYPGESHDWLLFCLTLIGQSRSHDLIKNAIAVFNLIVIIRWYLLIKNKIILYVSIWFLFYRT